MRITFCLFGLLASISTVAGNRSGPLIPLRATLNPLQPPTSLRNKLRQPRLVRSLYLLPVLMPSRIQPRQRQMLRRPQQPN